MSAVPAPPSGADAPLRLRHKLGLAAAAAMTSLAALECLARLFPVAHGTIVRPSTIPNVGYQLIDNWDVITKEHRFHLNRWGFKGQDFPLDKAPGTFRLALLGDSVLYGEDSAPNDPGPTLQRLLSDRPPPGLSARVEVINTAVPSYSTCQELAILYGYVDGFKPDAVVVGYVINDPEGVRSPFGLDVSKGELPLRHRLYHWLKRRSAALRWAVFQVSPMVTRWRGHGGYGPAAVSQNDPVAYMKALHDPQGDFWPRAAECMAGFGRYQEEKGVPVVFLVFPELDHLASPDLQAIYRQITSEVERNGILAMSLHPVFAAQKDIAPLRGDGVHPTPAGYLLALEAAHKFLLEHPAVFEGRGRRQHNAGGTRAGRR